jgi:hypothetical protein
MTYAALLDGLCTAKKLCQRTIPSAPSRLHVPKKQNIGYNRATADASRGDKKMSENARKQLPERKANALRGNLAPRVSDKNLNK